MAIESRNYPSESEEPVILVSTDHSGTASSAVEFLFSFMGWGGVLVLLLGLSSYLLLVRIDVVDLLATFILGGSFGVLVDRLRLRRIFGRTPGLPRSKYHGDSRIIGVVPASLVESVEGAKAIEEDFPPEVFKFRCGLWSMRRCTLWGRYWLWLLVIIDAFLSIVAKWDPAASLVVVSMVICVIRAPVWLSPRYLRLAPQSLEILGSYWWTERVWPIACSRLRGRVVVRLDLGYACIYERDEPERLELVVPLWALDQPVRAGSTILRAAASHLHHRPMSVNSLCG